MSFVDELERALFAHDMKWLRAHGPRLLAAVKFAEHEVNGTFDSIEAMGLSAWWLEVSGLLEAYRTACAGDSETGRLNKGE